MGSAGQHLSTSGRWHVRCRCTGCRSGRQCRGRWSVNELTVDTMVPVVTVENSLTTTDTSPGLTGTVDDPTATVVVTVASHDYPAVVVGTAWTLAAGTITPGLTAGSADCGGDCYGCGGEHRPRRHAQ